MQGGPAPYFGLSDFPEFPDETIEQSALGRDVSVCPRGIRREVRREPGGEIGVHEYSYRSKKHVPKAWIELLREVFVETVAFREVIRPDLGGYFGAKRTSVQSAESREPGSGEL